MAPLFSGCNGDSGGPFYSGTPAVPVVHGVVSFGGRRCGADHLPSVFTEVTRFRAFLTDPTPAWAPTAPGSAVATLKGARRVGGRLTCVPPRFGNAVTRTTTTWLQVDRGRQHHLVGSKTYTVRRADRGHRINCRITAGNAGGYVSVIARGALIRR